MLDVHLTEPVLEMVLLESGKVLAAPGHLEGVREFKEWLENSAEGEMVNQMCRHRTGSGK